MKRQRLNRASVVVYYPDGYRWALETQRTAKIATDPKAFGRWLIEAGAAILDGCEPGHHAKAEREQ